MKKQLPKILKHRLVPFVVLILTALTIAFVLLIPRAGYFLITQDDLHKSDVIVVLMGSFPDRILEAIDIYHQGYAPKIVMVEPFMPGYEKLIEKGIDVPGYADICVITAVKLGVPSDDIIVLPKSVRSTQEEANAIKEYLKENAHINSIILVTSKYHSTRAKKIFEETLKSLGRDITIISYPSKYDDFNPEKWWQSREDAKKVFFEYVKLLYFYITKGYVSFSNDFSYNLLLPVTFNVSGSKKSISICENFSITLIYSSFCLFSSSKQ